MAIPLTVDLGTGDIRHMSLTH
ncbi:hypothetical protein CCACVL1_01041 [Corchorus capsularis]|uniref:Uncharacterized protein n=1 Tax=Corchorus capsularis TaxID=210143 RepID=A0A1R3KRQ0_COCAP|nr:hypothetical protein CCACVL1_01041 [Corchorus capsularis]